MMFWMAVWSVSLAAIAVLYCIGYVQWRNWKCLTDVVDTDGYDKGKCHER